MRFVARVKFRVARVAEVNYIESVRVGGDFVFTVGQILPLAWGTDATFSKIQTANARMRNAYHCRRFAVNGNRLPLAVRFVHAAFMVGNVAAIKRRIDRRVPRLDVRNRQFE